MWFCDVSWMCVCMKIEQERFFFIDLNIDMNKFITNKLIVNDMVDMICSHHINRRFPIRSAYLTSVCTLYTVSNLVFLIVWKQENYILMKKGFLNFSKCSNANHLKEFTQMNWHFKGNIAHLFERARAILQFCMKTCK